MYSEDYICIGTEATENCLYEISVILKQNLYLYLWKEAIEHLYEFTIIGLVGGVGGIWGPCPSFILN